MKLRDGFMKVIWLLMTDNAIACVSKKMQQIKLFFFKNLVMKNSK